MKDFKQEISEYSNKDLEIRKNWYSNVAEAYNQARPRYPHQIIRRAVELAQLPPQASILEVGCGPGTATVGFAELGFSMVCLEPSPEACQLAQENCTQYANVEIQNTSFEEWELEASKFHAVLAATSFHWIPPEVGYPKAASALVDNGCLILLWNMLLEPRYEVYQELQPVYQKYAPFLARYEGREKQEDNLRGLAEIVMESGQFRDLESDHVACEVTYTTDEYLTLLNTYSQCIKLDIQNRDALFAGLREKIEEQFGGSIELFYLSACQIARKN
ncbi:MAG: class I SAM-dependent methyltransferase [Nostocaceae cyanobacterium]|nr:class I SAM-dependent methyltransferase [Nostocaceae cyanobacterium]